MFILLWALPSLGKDPTNTCSQEAFFVPTLRKCILERRVMRELESLCLYPLVLFFRFWQNQKILLSVKKGNRDTTKSASSFATAFIEFIFVVAGGFCPFIPALKLRFRTARHLPTNLRLARNLLLSS